MRLPKWLLLVGVGLLGAALHGHANPEPGDDADRARRRLEQLRADPERYERLQADYRAFQALPPERQGELRALDRGLHEADPATQNRLLAVLGRYRAWLDGLSPNEYALVAAAETSGKRLAVIRDIRERQWIKHLPAATRKELAKLAGAKRRQRIAELRREEHQLRERWQLRPARLSEFPPEVREYVRQVLRPRLKADDNRRLNQADGKWPLLATTLLDLAELYPTLPPPRVPYALVRQFDDLPEGVQKKLEPLRAEVQKHEGKWPDYALALIEAARKHKRLRALPVLGPSAPEQFPPETAAFINERLKPNLTDKEAKLLATAQGRWPEYPRRVAQLAKNRHWPVPHMTLPPGPPELWEHARRAQLEVPGHVLRDFALGELSAAERARLGLSPANPAAARQRLTEEFFKAKPRERERVKHLNTKGFLTDKPR